MGFEYRAEVESHLKQAALNKIRELLKCISLFEVLDNQKRAQILFRWSSHPLDPKWPEDAIITLEEDHIYLLIHGATGPESKALIEEIRGNLGIEFQEM